MKIYRKNNYNSILCYKVCCFFCCVIILSCKRQQSMPDNAKAERIVFVNKFSGVNHIYLMDINGVGIGTNVIRLTNDVEAENYPACSPDGKKILYQRDYNGAAIYVINIDGTGQQRIGGLLAIERTISTDALRAGIHPVGLQPLQLVLETHFFRRHQAQPRVIVTGTDQAIKINLGDRHITTAPLG